MKKKILLLVLCMLMIVPLFVVSSSANVAIDPINSWSAEILPDDTFLLSQYGEFRMIWFCDSRLEEDTKLNAFSGTSSSNFNSVVFRGKKTFNGVTLPEGEYPMILAVHDQYIHDTPSFSYVYRSNYFRFKWYMTEGGLCTVAVYDSVLSDDPIMVVNVGLDCTLFMDETSYSFNYHNFNIEFYFEFSYLDYMNIQYNSYYRGGFECFQHCFGSDCSGGRLPDNIIMPDIAFQNYRAGYDLGVEYGASLTQEQAYNEGYSYGIVDGRDDAIRAVDGVPLIIGSLFEAPYRFLATFLDVELFGINIFNIVSSVIGIGLIAGIVFLLVKIVGKFV